MFGGNAGNPSTRRKPIRKPRVQKTRTARHMRLMEKIKS